jgi:hypothetical protein
MEGQAIFSNAIPRPLKWQKPADGARFYLGYTTDQFPVDLCDEVDIFGHQNHLENLPGITVPSGTV